MRLFDYRLRGTILHTWKQLTFSNSGTVATKRGQSWRQQQIIFHNCLQKLYYCNVVGNKSLSDGLHKLSPYDFQDILVKENISRCFVLKKDDHLEYSHELLKDILEESQLKELEYDHEAIFFERGQRSGCLMSVFLWKTNRGQGVRKQ